MTHICLSCKRRAFHKDVPRISPGEEVLVLLKLLISPKSYQLRKGSVGHSPRRTGNRPAGIGIEFSKEDAVLNATIENYFGERYQLIG
ncbi:MAG: hypothetical protein CM15mP84_07340 [Cellvibrionales bacterium]|nr:MAG: hypothetical protein CM15mP84_07340 [Cellvibrionales bacterium]